MPKGDKLTLKQRQFVKEYVSNKGNGTRAALAVYDTDSPVVAQNLASENLLKPLIAEGIEAELEKAGLTDSKISENLSSIANLSPEKPVSATEIIRANELALKIKGRLNKTTTKVSYSVTERLTGSNFNELKAKLSTTKQASGELLADIEAES